MEVASNRLVYLDNIRNFLVYNVVVLHILQMFAYPLLFWWAVIDQPGSSRANETLLVAMDVYLMPGLLFIAALFIFPSLKKYTPLEYLKKRFLRLCVPAVVYLFCAGDIFYQILLRRLDGPVPPFAETFLNFWRFFLAMPAVYLSGSEGKLHTVTFNMQHVWFLSLLFFLTLAVVAGSAPFRRQASPPQQADSKRKIITVTVVFALLLGLAYTAVQILYIIHHIYIGEWLIIGKVLQFPVHKIWPLLALFLFGLYIYKREWLSLSDIGHWMMWGTMALISLALYVLLFFFNILPELEGMFLAAAHNMRFDDLVPVPPPTLSLQRAFLSSWLLMPLVCVFLLMAFLSLAKRFANQTNAVTTFCSRHSINVYVLHYPAVLILQYMFFDVPLPPAIKVILMTVLVIPACLWLSHRLVYPYPKTAIGFFVALKLAALVAGFTFYYFALLTLTFISFAGAVYESAKWYRVGRRTGRETASPIE